MPAKSYPRDRRTSVALEHVGDLLTLVALVIAVVLVVAAIVSFA